VSARLPLRRILGGLPHERFIADFIERGITLDHGAPREEVEEAAEQVADAFCDWYFFGLERLPQPREAEEASPQSDEDEAPQPPRALPTYRHAEAPHRRERRLAAFFKSKLQGEAFLQREALPPQAGALDAAARHLRGEQETRRSGRTPKYSQELQTAAELVLLIAETIGLPPTASRNAHPRARNLGAVDVVQDALVATGKRAGVDDAGRITSRALGDHVAKLRIDRMTSAEDLLKGYVPREDLRSLLTAASTGKLKALEAALAPLRDEFARSKKPERKRELEAMARELSLRTLRN
jgi:hypothetical protein